MGRPLNPPLSKEERAKLDELKMQICWRLRQSIARQGYRPGYAAIKIGTSWARVNEVEMGDVKDLTLNQLFNYLVRLEPNFQILIAF